MTEPVTVVGKNSYLAGHFLATEMGPSVKAVTHNVLDSMDFLGTGCIVNFAYPPSYMTDPYDPANDMDRVLMDRIKETDIHFIMISSRKVYNLASPGPWSESSALAGQDVYGRNKIITEECVRENLDGRHTILRLGNIIETEPGRHTFLGIALRTLKEKGRINLNVDPATKRDFLPVNNFAAALEKVVRAKPVGTYNLASGLETPVGYVAAWIVEGYGSGEVVSEPDGDNDAFVLDISRLESIIGPICSRDDIRRACMESGRQLRDG